MIILELSRISEVDDKEKRVHVLWIAYLLTDFGRPGCSVEVDIKDFRLGVEMKEMATTQRALTKTSYVLLERCCDGTTTAPPQLNACDSRFLQITNCRLKAPSSVSAGYVMST